MIQHYSAPNATDAYIPAEILEDIVDSLNGFVFERYMTGERNYTFISRKCLDILGYSPEELYSNPNLTEDLLVNDDTFKDVYKGQAELGHNVMEFSICTQSGQVRYLRSIFDGVYDDDKLIKYRGIVFDITQEVKNAIRLHNEINENELLEKIVSERTKAVNELLCMQEKMESLNSELLFRATHDLLTGVGNRQMLKECLDQAQYQKEQVCLILVDLKRFKRINDALGYSVGDEILIEAATRIKQCITPVDTLVRFSGDKFAVVVPFKASSSQEKNNYHVYSVIERIKKAFEPIFEHRNKLVTIDVNVGASYSHTYEFVAEDLLRFAEITLRQNKEQKCRPIEPFNHGLAYQLEHQLDHEIKVREALKQKNIMVWYQPIVDMLNQQVIGAEALARWIHPERGLLTAEQFLPTVEEADLLAVLADILPKQVVQFRKNINHLVDSSFCIKMNLDTISFTQNVVQRIISYVKRENCHPAGIGFEITESNAMHNIPEAVETITYLKKIGVKVEIDDFGTGYSNFSRLLDLPISGLKLDRSFLSDMMKKDTSRALISSIATLASQLKLQLIAEGIETEEQRQAALSLGVKTGQGFLWAPALPPEKFKQLLMRNESLAYFSNSI